MFLNKHTDNIQIDKSIKVHIATGVGHKFVTIDMGVGHKNETIVLGWVNKILQIDITK